MDNLNTLQIVAVAATFLAVLFLLLVIFWPRKDKAMRPIDQTIERVPWTDPSFARAPQPAPVTAVAQFLNVLIGATRTADQLEEERMNLQPFVAPAWPSHDFPIHDPAIDLSEKPQSFDSFKDWAKDFDGSKPTHESYDRSDDSSPSDSSGSDSSTPD